MTRWHYACLAAGSLAGAVLTVITGIGADRPDPPMGVVPAEHVPLTVGDKLYDCTVNFDARDAMITLMACDPESEVTGGD